MSAIKQEFRPSYWKHQAEIRQRIIDRQDVKLVEAKATIDALTASVVQLENDYDQIEGELKAVVLSAKAVRTPAKVTVL